MGRQLHMKNARYAFVLIADEKYWKRLCERNSTDRAVHVFVRKNQVGPCKAQKLLFYVKKPIMQVRGVADFIERLTGNGEELWRKYGAESCFESYGEYTAFAEGREKMTFVRFKNFTKLEKPKSTEIARMVLGSLRWFRPKYLSFEATQQLVT
jgi:predicted transcriptional regulator